MVQSNGLSAGSAPRPPTSVKGFLTAWVLLGCKWAGASLRRVRRDKVPMFEAPFGIDPVGRRSQWLALIVCYGARLKSERPTRADSFFRRLQLKLGHPLHRGGLS